MVPQLETVAQQRYRVLASQNGSSSSSLFIQQPAKRPSSAGRGLVTYGKSTRPLSLTGKQFFGPGTYDVPSEHDDRMDRARTRSPAAARQEADSSDSLLSDAEPVTPPRPIHDKRISRGPTKLEILEAAASASGRPGASASTAQSRKATARTVRKTSPKPIYAPEPNTVREKMAKTVRNAGVQVYAQVSKSSKRQPRTPARRLPVNELFLVASAPQNESLFDPASSAVRFEIQDPIKDLSSQPRRWGVSHISSDSADDSPKTRAPLTAIRKRLKTSKFRHKVLKPKQTARSLFHTTQTSETIVGDGFATSELHIDHRIRLRKQRKRKPATSFHYNVLELFSGALPDVVLECSTDELQLEPSGGPHHVSQTRDYGQMQPHPLSIKAIKETRRASTDELQLEPLGDDHHVAQDIFRRGQPYSISGRSSQPVKRRVSFSERDELLVAQLSSISAPARQCSESDDEDELDLDVQDSDEDDVGSDDLDYKDAVNGELLLNKDELEKNASSPDRPDEGADGCSGVVLDHDTSLDVISDQPNNSGVTLDFHKPAIPGILPRRSLGRRNLVEVDDAIVDMPERATVEVPRSELVQPDTDGANGVLDITTHRRRKARPRSILKNSTPMVPDSTCRPEDTAANTRRNSMVLAEDSRYFANATDVLRSPDPTRHKIMPRRSSYFDTPHVQVAHSGGVVLETSPPEPPDYTIPHQLSVLHRSSESVYTSQSLPTVSKDLKTLTRTVSREHGTLSQSVKRRPSLPFQSPVKMR